jgi:hypothetical protein
MQVTILHLSDLHRDSGSHISTAALIEALRLDRERYATDGKISKPDLAIVSGDVVYGVSSGDGDAKLQAQYDEAHDFLVSLADTFFDGDRERIVIVPGNHDISIPHVDRATSSVDLPSSLDQRALLAQELAKYETLFRWASNNFTLHRIDNIAEYHNRLQPFARFYSRFYEENRSFSLEPSAQYSIHDFPAFGLVVGGLSSCYNNDIYNRTGRIHPTCVASLTRELAEFVRRRRLALAVWHHSLQGGPTDGDYLDADVLQSLIDGGLSLGMHGHQHRPQLVEHRFTADRKQGIVVVSAGTLCGGPASLPSGRMRAYNLIVIDTERRTGCLHVRDMKNSDFARPVWGPAYVAEFSGSSLPFELTAPPSRDSVFQIAGDAERLLRRGDALGAYNMVVSHMTDPFARRVAAEALGELRDWQEVRSRLHLPQSPAEFVLLCDALYELGDKTALSRLIQSRFALASTDPGVADCINLMKARIGPR